VKKAACKMLLKLRPGGLAGKIVSRTLDPLRVARDVPSALKSKDSVELGYNLTEKESADENENALSRLLFDLTLFHLIEIPTDLSSYECVQNFVVVAVVT